MCFSGAVAKTMTPESAKIIRAPSSLCRMNHRSMGEIAQQSFSPTHRHLMNELNCHDRFEVSRNRFLFRTVALRRLSVCMYIVQTQFIEVRNPKQEEPLPLAKKRRHRFEREAKIRENVSVFIHSLSEIISICHRVVISNKPKQLDIDTSSLAVPMTSDRCRPTDRDDWYSMLEHYRKTTPRQSVSKVSSMLARRRQRDSPNASC